MEALYSVSYSSSKRNLAICLVDLTVLPWKSTASLNELHPSLLSVLYVLFIWSLQQQFLFCCSTSYFSLFSSWTNILVIPAVPPGQAQEHKLSVPRSPTDKTVCKIIVSCWICSPVQVRLMEFHAPRSCGYQDWAGIPNRQPHTIIQCTCTHSQTQRAAQTWHKAHTNANSTDGVIHVPSLADEAGRLLVKNYKYIHAIWIPSSWPEIHAPLSSWPWTFHLHIWWHLGM